MTNRLRRHEAGFTLTEMAIVLAVVGVLIAGLWQLISGANQTSRDTSVATQQAQLINAVKEFLLSSYGQDFMSLNANCGGTSICGANSTFALPLPGSSAGSTACLTDGTLGAAMTGTNGANEMSTWCGYLPPGFTNTTVNSYGQKYTIRILRDSTLNPAGSTPPNSYSFMILTSGSTVIPDSSGGRISSLIGGDGGFIYSAPVCTAAASSKAACGSYGGWSVTDVTAAGPAGFGFGAPANSGLVASRTYVSPQQNLLSNWLARVQMDPGFVLNTMTVPEYLGGNALDMGSYAAVLAATGGGNINMQSGNIYFANSAGGTSTGALNMQGGSIYLGLAGTAGSGTLSTFNAQGGTINLGDPGDTVGVNGGTVNMQGGTINLLVAGTTSTVSTGTGEINLQGGEITSLIADSAANPSGWAGNDALVLDGSKAQPGGNSVITANMPCNVASFDPTTQVSLDGSGNPCSFAIQTSSILVPGMVQANGFQANTFIYNSGGTVSDIRMKMNIHTLANPLDGVERLNPVTFAFKADGKESMGVIAQEIEKVYPQLVGVGPDGMKYVNYGGLVAPLIGAVQELKKENDELRRKIAADEARQDKMEKELRQNASH